MNAITIGTAPDTAFELARAEHRRYICQRVLDALLREDVRACASGATLVSRTALPAELSKHEAATRTWLKVAHFNAGLLWIPVVRAAFMQDWRSAGLPLLWQQAGTVAELYAVEDILACFACGLSPSASLLFQAFADECKIAASQRHASETERERWFAELRSGGSDAELPDWHARLLHYDRLGAFLDHPLYPTARAKLGFDDAALAALWLSYTSNIVLVLLSLFLPDRKAEFSNYSARLYDRRSGDHRVAQYAAHE
jgi:hypothetical protein